MPMLVLVVGGLPPVVPGAASGARVVPAIDESQFAAQRGVNERLELERSSVATACGLLVSYMPLARPDLESEVFCGRWACPEAVALELVEPFTGGCP